MCVAPEPIPDASREELAACARALLAERGAGTVAGDEIALTRAGATAVGSSALAKRVDGIALEHNPLLTALAGAAAAAEVAVTSGDGRQRGVTLHWCLALGAALDAHAAPESLAVGLTCLSRAASGLAAEPVLNRWPGCRCATRGAKRTTCLQGSSVSRPFPQAPIDERLVDALDEAIDRANRELAASNFTLVGLGVVGCHLARFERGGEVRTLEGATTPRLRFAHVSEHVLGTACDISYAWVRGGDGVVRGFSVHMFQLALLDPDDARYDPSPAHFAKWRREINRSGESAYFHALGAALPKPAPELVDHVLLIGVTLRNALLDAGLVVYTPATNSAHWNHFHVHLPVETNVWTETSRDETTRARREELVAPALRRAAGLDPATALAPPGDVLVRGRTVRVIKAVAEDGGTLIMIAAGAKDEVEQGDRGVLLDDDGRAVPGGAFRIVRVTARVAYARVALPMSQVSASPNARLAR